MASLIPIAASLALFVLPATTVFAQTCVGTASFASGPVRLGVGIDFAEDLKQYGAQIGVGKAAGPFAAVGVSRVDPDGTDESATAIAGEVGYSLNIAGRGTLEVCPLVGLGYTSAEVSEDGVTVDVSSRAISAGFAVGGVASSSPTFAFVPSVALFYVNQSLELESGGLEFDASEDFGVITLAAGLVFNQRITLRPNFSIPVGLDDSDPTYGISLAFGFGTPSAGR